MQTTVCRVVAFAAIGLVPGAAGAQPAPSPTAVPRIAAVAAPPAGFDALTASPRELAGYGFPPRPDPVHAQAAYAAWAVAMAARPRRIAPVLVRTRLHHGPARAGLANGTTGTSSNWSGAVVPGAATVFSQQSFTAVQGSFIVPSAGNATCVVGSDHQDHAAGWTGIDGWRSGDVLQAGYDATASCVAGVSALQSYAWLEWYPDAEVQITNFPVSAGQTLLVEVSASSATQGAYYLQNLNTNVAVSGTYTAPTGTHLIGEAAEWIVEAPTVGNSLAALADYGRAFVAGAVGQSKGGKVVDPGSPSTVSVTMVTGNGIAQSVPSLLGPAGVLFTYPGH